MNLHFEFVNPQVWFAWIYTQFISLHLLLSDIFVILIAFGLLYFLGVSQKLSDSVILLPIPSLYPIAKQAEPTVVRYVKISNGVTSIIVNYNKKIKKRDKNVR
jgi:hypothetical protein